MNIVRRILDFVLRPILRRIYVVVDLHCSEHGHLLEAGFDGTDVRAINTVNGYRCPQCGRLPILIMVRPFVQQVRRGETDVFQRWGLSSPPQLLWQKERTDSLRVNPAADNSKGETK